MALVIFCVALVAAMRTRMSLRLGMAVLTEQDRRTDTLHVGSRHCSVFVLLFGSR